MERDRTMSGQQLKNAILALAVQGKLVPQDPKDEPAAALLDRVKAEKARLVKAGKIKKEKTLPPITDAEKPFEIPAGWEWVRLGDIAKKLTDGSHNPPPNTGIGYPVISAQCINNGKIDLTLVNRYTDIKGFEQENPRTNIEFGDLILGIIGASIGNTARFCSLVKVIAQRSVAIIRTLISDDYTFYVLQSPLIQNTLSTKKTGTAQPGVYLNELNKLMIPLPPLVEQKRIVEKIEELLPRVSAYDEAEQKLSRLDAEFPDKLKKSILQQAVQGKLAKQDKNDEPASELLKRIKAAKERLIAEGKIKKERPLPPIAEEEKSFEIPAGWEWVRFANLMEFISTGPFGSVLHKNEYVHNGIPIVNPACIQHGKIIPVERMSVAASTKERLKMYVLHAGNIVIGRRGELGRCAYCQ